MTKYYGTEKVRAKVLFHPIELLKFILTDDELKEIGLKDEYELQLSALHSWQRTRYNCPPEDDCPNCDEIDDVDPEFDDDLYDTINEIEDVELRDIVLSRVYEYFESDEFNEKLEWESIEREVPERDEE